MKHNYQHIIKKTYAKPVIEEVMLDYGTILMSPSPIDTGPGADFPAPPAPKESPDYGKDTYESPDTPFYR